MCPTLGVCAPERTARTTLTAVVSLTDSHATHLPETQNRFLVASLPRPNCQFSNQDAA